MDPAALDPMGSGEQAQPVKLLPTWWLSLQQSANMPASLSFQLVCAILLPAQVAQVRCRPHSNLLPPERSIALLRRDGSGGEWKGGERTGKGQVEGSYIGASRCQHMSAMCCLAAAGRARSQQGDAPRDRRHDRRSGAAHAGRPHPTYIPACLAARQRWVIPSSMSAPVCLRALRPCCSVASSCLRVAAHWQPVFGAMSDRCRPRSRVCGRRRLFGKTQEHCGTAFALCFPLPISFKALRSVTTAFSSKTVPVPCAPQSSWRSLPPASRWR